MTAPATTNPADGHLSIYRARSLPQQQQTNLFALPEEAACTSPPRSTAQLVATLAALFLSLSVAALDFTIVSTAIPTISNHFHSATGYTWIGSSYLLANAASTPLWGKMSDIWGRKIVLLVAIAVFFIGSLVCALSTSMGMLIAGRALQGSPAGGIVVLVNVCISDLFSLRNRGLVLGLTGIVWTVASGIGPVLGGVFAELVSWRWIWYLNLPVSGIAFVTLLLCLDVHNPRTKLMPGIRAVDWLGAVAITGFTIMLLLGLNYGGVTFPWDSVKVLGLIVFGIVMLALFLFNEVKLARYPIMPLNLFSKRSNIAALVTSFCHGFTYISAGYFLPLYFQSVAAASPLRSGILVVPVAVIQSATYLLGGVIIWKTGQYQAITWVGMALLTIGFSLCITLDSHFSSAKSISYQVVAGLGIGLVFEAPLVALQSRVSQADVATATATFGFVRNLATSMSIVLGGVVFQNGMEAQSKQLSSVLGHTNAARLTGGEAAANVMLLRELHGAALAAARQAFANALKDMWIMYAGVAAVGFLSSLFIGNAVLSKDHVETRTGLLEKSDASDPIALPALTRDAEIVQNLDV